MVELSLGRIDPCFERCLDCPEALLFYRCMLIKTRCVDLLGGSDWLQTSQGKKTQKLRSR